MYLGANRVGISKSAYLAHSKRTKTTGFEIYLYNTKTYCCYVHEK